MQIGAGNGLWDSHDLRKGPILSKDYRTRTKLQQQP